jgi:hypothetical protein
MSDAHAERAAFFGCYLRFYDHGLDYLNLLHLGQGPSGIAELRSAIAMATWKADSIRLLRDGNWRSHLAPIVAYAARGIPDSDITRGLWGAVQQGSWVSPQIIVVLSLMDDDFLPHLSNLFHQGIALEERDPLIAHVTAGPGNDQSRLGKMANAVLGLYPNMRHDQAWTALVAAAPHDFDQADQLAVRWKQSLKQMLANQVRPM